MWARCPIFWSTNHMVSVNITTPSHTCTGGLVKYILSFFLYTSQEIKLKTWCLRLNFYPHKCSKLIMPSAVQSLSIYALGNRYSSMTSSAVVGGNKFPAILKQHKLNTVSSQGQCPLCWHSCLQASNKHPEQMYLPTRFIFMSRIVPTLCCET